jgi:hypothetical protein
MSSFGAGPVCPGRESIMPSVHRFNRKVVYAVVIASAGASGAPAQLPPFPPPKEPYTADQKQWLAEKWADDILRNDPAWRRGFDGVRRLGVAYLKTVDLIEPNNAFDDSVAAIPIASEVWTRCRRTGRASRRSIGRSPMEAVLPISALQ